MSKQVRWQIPFVSRLGTAYRVDIYDEGYTGSPVQLLGGTSPFTTDEDSSDDYFAPIRVQTGTLTVCTHDEDGNVLITLDDILPANNIARPVRLVSISGSTETIEWQGFLSCEAYDQDYTDIPQHLQLPVISVLEAMASVEVQLDESKAFLRILGHVCNAMKAIETESGMSDMWGSMYLSQYCRSEMLAKYFYNNVYFSTEEQVSGDNIVVEVHSISCKDILSQVAQFFGGCWREKGKDLYFEVIGKTNDFDYQTFANVYDESVNGHSKFWQSVSMTTDAQISQLAWAGTNHQRTVAQGAKRVKVTAGLDDFECKMTLQECPIGSLVVNPSSRWSKWGEVHANTNETFYSLAEHKHMKVKAVFSHNGESRVAALQYLENLQSVEYLHTSPWELDLFRGGTTPHQGAPNVYDNYSLAIYYDWNFPDGFLLYLTSYMAFWRNKDNELQSGLMLCGVPRRLMRYVNISPQPTGWTQKFSLTQDNYLYKISTPLVYTASSGYFIINIETLAWMGKTGKDQNIRGDVIAPNITIAVQFGDKWLTDDETKSFTSLDRYSWSDTFATIKYYFGGGASDGEMKARSNWIEDLEVDQADGLFVPVRENTVGFVSIRLYHEIDALSDTQISESYVSNQCMFDVFISKLEISHVYKNNAQELLTDRSENVYAQNLGTAYRDEIDTSVEIATDANNTKLATMLWQSDGITPVKLLSLGGRTIRPEVDLLNRLAAYYGAARQRLDLIVEHPTAAPLPLLRLNGISPDSRTYAPLAESRDWQQDSSTLKCFEIPTE